MQTVLIVLLAAPTVALALLGGYLLVLTVAAAACRRPAPAPGPARRRFAVLIPAHNEEALIERLLRSLAAQDYPASRYIVYVVADNCHDRTAELARAAGARVYERFDYSAQAKGYALAWLLARIREEGEPFHAYVFVDADSVAAPNLLSAFDARLTAGSQVVQARYTSLNSDESPLAALRYAALVAVNHLRPLGKLALGLSCGLKGTGMGFTAAIVEQYGWRWHTLAEDVEFHLALAHAGVRVDFVPETWVRSEMPATYAEATSQNLRWERGRLLLWRQQVPRLLWDGLRRHNVVALDAAAEQCVPPLSVPFALGGLCLLGGVVAGAPLIVALAAISLGAQLAQLLVGLALVRAPLRTFLALGHAPRYIAWKLGVYGRSLFATGATRWVRTARPAATRE